MPAPRIAHKIVWAVVLGAVLLALALARLYFLPFHNALDVHSIVLALHQIAEQFGAVAAILVFALALVCVVPLSLLTVVAIVAFGPLHGFVYAMLGAQLAALGSYGLGAALGRDILRTLAGVRINRLSEKLGERGLWAVVAVRVVPVAPFAVVNLVAGASHIRLPDLLLGTVIGMLPGTLAMALSVDKILDAMQNPSKTSVLAVVGTLALVGLGVWGLKVWWRRATSP